MTANNYCSTEGCRARNLDGEDICCACYLDAYYGESTLVVEDDGPGADTNAQYEILCSYPTDWLRAERDALITSIARGLEGRRSAEPSDWNLPVAEVEAMVMIRDMVADLGVKGPAGQVLAARFVSESSNHFNGDQSMTASANKTVHTGMAATDG